MAGNWRLVSLYLQVVRASLYELAQSWTEARIRAGVSGYSSIQSNGWFNGPSPKLTSGLIQFRLGRYADALATLRSNDIPKLSQTAGMFMSPWSLPAS